MNYNEKYLKYKQKYINLKKQFGGQIPVITKNTKYFNAGHVNDSSLYSHVKKNINVNIIKIIFFQYKIAKGKFDSYYLM